MNDIRTVKYIRDTAVKDRFTFFGIMHSGKIKKIKRDWSNGVKNFKRR